MIIYVDRLKDGKVEIIKETLPPEFLGINEADLSFVKEITIRGEAYLAEDHLFISIDAQTAARLPCQICNRATELPIHIKKFTHTEELKELSSSTYDCGPLLREAILLQIPPFMECEKNKCPERKDINKYLNKQTESIHFPFADLDKQ